MKFLIYHAKEEKEELTKKKENEKMKKREIYREIHFVCFLLFEQNCSIQRGETKLTISNNM